MTAYNIVRNRVKPGREQDLEQAFRERGANKYPGMRKLAVIKTGERDYCIIGEWDSMEALAAARPEMIKTLDGIRDMLEDLGDGIGVTDAVSGEAVSESS